VNEGTSEDIAQKLKDMGASLEDEDGFIKHLFHLSQQMKMGRYIMDNPDFIPDIMQAFKGLDESSWMCTKCGQQPCVGGPACGTMGTDEPGPNNPFPADPKNGGYHRPDVNPYNGEEMSEGSGCPCCGDGPCNCESGCEGCDCGGQIDELDKKTLGSYIQKANDQTAASGVHVGANMDADPMQHRIAKRNKATIDKRQAGIKTAVSKLTREEEQTDEAKAPKYNFAVYDKDGKLKGASSNEKDAKSHAFRIKGEVKKLDKPTTGSDIDKMMAMGESRIEEEEMAYEAAMMDLIQLAGISTADTNIAEIKGKVVPKKGENVGFGMVDKTGLDPIVAEEAMDDTFIAKKVRDMGASLEDQKDFIKHLAHVAKELELGKYVMDNPDFVPDVMMAFKNLDEAEGCPCCGDGPCKCASDCKGCDCAPVEEVAPVAGMVGSAIKTVGAKLAQDKMDTMRQEIEDDKTNETDVYSESDAEDLLALFDLGDQETDEAIGDGFLSGNKALGAAMQDIEDEIKESDINALESTINDLKKLAGI
jgi:hypothetical protein